MYKYCNHCMSAIENDKNVCANCGRNILENVPAHHLLPGTILNNKYYVGKALGEGGFGITYIGRDINLDIKVAIKEYYPNGYVNRNNTISPQVNNSVTAGRKEFFTKGREKFLNEARVLARFSGEPGIVFVRDFFEENDTAYIVMEYLDGMDLKNYLKRNGKLTVEQTINLLMPVMNSLKKIHSQNLIHRDISPDNIMIVGNDVKLLDFGSARSVAAFENKSLSVMLKPGYAPEEQYRTKGQQGPWTDIYALCATIYKCITGITPDEASQRVFEDEVKMPSALGVKISPEMEKAIMKGMSVYHKDRYQSIDDLLNDLQSFRRKLEWEDLVTITLEENFNEYIPETRSESKKEEILVERSVTKEKNNVLTSENNTVQKYEISPITQKDEVVPKIDIDDDPGTALLFEDMDKEVFVEKDNSSTLSSTDVKTTRNDIYDGLENPIYATLKEKNNAKKNIKEKQNKEDGKKKTIFIVVAIVAIVAIFVTTIAGVLIREAYESYYYDWPENSYENVEQIDSTEDYENSVPEDSYETVEQFDISSVSEGIYLGDGYSDSYTQLSETVYGCRGFDFYFAITDVSYGDPYGWWTIYTRDMNGNWNSVYSFECTPGVIEYSFTTEEVLPAFDAYVFVMESPESTECAWSYQLYNFIIVS